jgi:molecular chaperone Hsp33
VRLAAGELHNADGESFRAGGMMIQNIAEDDARGSTEEGWNRARALFETLREDELIDPLLAPETLLFRLFHEDGVCMFTPKPCTPIGSVPRIGCCACCRPSRRRPH